MTDKPSKEDKSSKEDKPSKEDNLMQLNANDYKNLLHIVNNSEFKGCEIKYLAFLVTKLEHLIKQG